MTLACIEQKGKRIIGVDEAGRGPWAGPVVAASVLLKSKLLAEDYYQEINDSKKLSETKREKLYHKLVSDSNVEYGYSFVDNNFIDASNILIATKQAMLNSVNTHKEQHDIVLVDGNQKIAYTKTPVEAVIGGDGQVLEIAAASIIAKYLRDQYMQAIDKEFPEYGFAKHKGYGTKQHMEALAKYGPCKYHRVSFKPVAKLLT